MNNGKVTFFIVIAILYLLVIFLYFNVFFLALNVRSINEQQPVTGQSSDTEIPALKKTIQKQENNISELKEKLIETEFFSNNEKRYSYNNEAVLFSHCCTSASEDSASGFLGYDLLVEDPIGSGNYDDFGTTSYIKFDNEEKINSFEVTPIGSMLDHPIYMIVVDTNSRHTEGIVYPISNPEYTTYYERLYEVINDNLDYTVEVIPFENGYDINVSAGWFSDVSNNIVRNGEYELTVNDNGYDVVGIENVNDPGHNE